MPPVRTHDAEQAVPEPSTVRPRIVRKTWEEEFADRIKKQRELNRKARLVEASLPILASKTSTKEEKLQAAEDLRLGTYGNGGMDDVICEHGMVLHQLLGKYQVQARKDYKSFLRYPSLVLEALEVYGLAGKALLDLKRPKKHGDARRAFMLLKTFMFTVMDALINFHDPGREAWDLIYRATWRDWQYPPGAPTSREVEYLAFRMQCQRTTPEDIARIAKEKEDIFDYLHSNYDEPFCAAAERYKSEVSGKKKVEALCKQGYDWSLEHAHRCNELWHVCGYNYKAKDGLARDDGEGSADSGYAGPEPLHDEMFPLSRMELRGWYYEYKALGRPPGYYLWDL